MSIFDSVQTPNPGYNKFDLSYTNTLTAKMGKIIPIYHEHLLPGDKFRIKSNLFLRLMPLATPAFGNLRVIVRYFFVPYRLLFSSQDPYDSKSFEYFISGGTSDGDPTNVNLPGYFPKVKRRVRSEIINDFKPGTLADYMGVNIGPSTLSDDTKFIEFSALPFLAYNRIWNDWYRDENVDAPVTSTITEDADGLFAAHYDDIPTQSSDKKGLNVIRSVRWHKDYFTSALLSPTNGPEQLLPLVGGDLSVLGDFASDLYKPDSGYAPISLGSDGKYYAEYNNQQNGPLNSTGTPDGLYADSSNSYMASIRDLRNSIATQRFLEISARGGNRYIEQIFAHFGVRSLDARLQRAEFLGGGITPVNVGEVLQTSESSNTPLGEMAGRGVAYGNDNSCQYFASEHGILLGLMTIQPEAQYFQGLSRHFTKFDRLDYYWPSFAHVGDQEIKNYEIFNDPNSDDNDSVFGYAPRYAEYKFHANEIHGQLKSTMNKWTFARKFANTPTFNKQFLTVPNITSPFAVEDDTDKYIVHISHSVSALRKMPYYGNPSLIG